MNRIDDGGPAFARPASNDGSTLVAERDGMSLRDYFAAAAMQSITLNTAQFANDKLARRIAKGAYRVADAMLAVRKAGA